MGEGGKKLFLGWSWSAVFPIIFNPSKKRRFCCCYCCFVFWFFFFLWFLNQNSVLLYQEEPRNCISWSSLLSNHLLVSPIPLGSDFWPLLLTALQHLIDLAAFLTAQATAEQLVLTQQNQWVWVDPVLRLVGQAAWAVGAGGELFVEHCAYSLSSHLLLLTLRDLEGKPEEEGQSPLPNREIAC